MIIILHTAFKFHQPDFNVIFKDEILSTQKMFMGTPMSFNKDGQGRIPES
jgi:hypothetical protein